MFLKPVYDPCRSIPQWKLLWLTIDQCDMGRRLVVACVLGATIGWERRAPDRPAGIRTMSLVSLGSCLFTLCSTFGFLSGPMEWDAARVAAAIPSGVGFLGSALIFKHTTQENNAWHEVHGLSTAASVWLAAAVGIACAGAMYFVASFTTSIILVLLRFGPRPKTLDDDDDDEENEDEDSDVVESGDTQFVNPAMKQPSSYSFFTTDPELQPIMSSLKRSSLGRGELQKGLSKRSLRPSLM
jgi:putative Mg2+ transporter-C (MgtC) family protein